jgi:hypothetical protein
MLYASVAGQEAAIAHRAMWGEPKAQGYCLVHAQETSLGMVGMAFRSLAWRERETRAWPKMSFETALVLC